MVLTRSQHKRQLEVAPASTGPEPAPSKKREKEKRFNQPSTHRGHHLIAGKGGGHRMVPKVEASTRKKLGSIALLSGEVLIDAMSCLSYSELCSVQVVSRRFHFLVDGARRLAISPRENQWNSEDKSQKLEITSDDKLSVARKGVDNHDWATIRSSHPINTSVDVYYYEVEVESTYNSFITVGLVDSLLPVDRYPKGHDGYYGYHGNMGHFYSSGEWRQYGSSYNAGDVVGCGLDFQRGGELFFTLNGVNLGVATSVTLPINKLLFPMVSMGWSGDAIKANFGAMPFVFDLDVYMRQR